MERRILLLQVAGLGYNFLARSLGKAEVGGLAATPMAGMFPALTCPVQATMRTAAPASGHGIVGNGFFSTELWKPLFWEQSSRLVQGPRIWEDLRRRGGTVGQLFIQQSLGPDADVVYSPAPIHKHHGGMILESIALPEELHARLHRELGVFPLQSYWGPLASIRSSRWIAAATESVMAHERPDLLYSYIPHLDYALQRYGPDSGAAQKACRQARCPGCPHGRSISQPRLRRCHLRRLSNHGGHRCGLSEQDASAAGMVADQTGQADAVPVLARQSGFLRRGSPDRSCPRVGQRSDAGRERIVAGSGGCRSRSRWAGQGGGGDRASHGAAI